MKKLYLKPEARFVDINLLAVDAHLNTVGVRLYQGGFCEQHNNEIIICAEP